MQRGPLSINSMWRSATSSEARRSGAGRRPAVAALTALMLSAAVVPAVTAGVYLTVDEALELAFPGCEIERRTIFLTEAQLERARDLASVPIEGGIAYPYQAVCEGEPDGTAYLDTHRVRTLAETLMIVVDPAGAVRRIEMLAFREPEDYIPGERWYGQFLERRLDSALDLKRGIRGVTGATLTARATTQAVRRVLALHRVIREADRE